MKVKICGLTSFDAVSASIEGGADYLGFVSCVGSVRHLEPENLAPLVSMAKAQSPNTPRVIVMVNPNDRDIDLLLNRSDVTHIQLHGQESPERLSQVQARFGVKLIKAFGISNRADLEPISLFSPLCEALLLDAKPPKNLGISGVTGGHGIGFEWSLLDGFAPTKPWFLAGGLNMNNVTKAIKMTKASMIDISSSLEISPGRKDLDMISRFLALAKSL